MKLFAWPRRAVRAIARASAFAVNVIGRMGTTILAPIGFREVLLLGGATLLSIGAGAVYPPAAFIAPAVVLVGVAVFGVRA